MLARRPPKEPRLGSCSSPAAAPTAFAAGACERLAPLSAAFTFPSIHRLTVMSQCPLPYVRPIVPGSIDRDAALLGLATGRATPLSMAPRLTTDGIRSFD